MEPRVILHNDNDTFSVAGFHSENISKVIDNKQSLKKVLHNLDTETIFYSSNGAWSSVDLLASLILKLPDVSDVYISTFSISEESANKIFYLSKNSNINFHLLVDWKMKLKNKNTVLFLQHFCASFGFSDCHSKLTCLVSEKRTHTVLSSANYTKNKRFESGVIVSDAQVSEMYVNQIKNLITNGIQTGAN